jgi:hypothetical protein
LLKTNGAGEPKLLGTAGEARDVQVVVERVLHPSNVCRRRGNHQLSIDQTLIIALSRAQHHEVLTEGNRSPVMICSDMLDSELGHLNPRSTSVEASTAPLLCTLRHRHAITIRRTRCERDSILYRSKKDARLPESRDVWKPYDRTSDPMADRKTINRAMTENPPPAR